jgi:SEC-C motif domain protein
VAGTKAAPTAEALMRSRYTAFSLGDVAHLARSWHPDTRPRHIHLGEGRRWVGLTVEATTAGGLLDQEGTVTFTARHLEPGADAPEELREASRFARVDGRWVYVGPTS